MYIYNTNLERTLTFFNFKMVVLQQRKIKDRLKVSTAIFTSTREKSTKKLKASTAVIRKTDNTMVKRKKNYKETNNGTYDVTLHRHLKIEQDETH